MRFNAAFSLCIAALAISAAFTPELSVAGTPPDEALFSPAELQAFSEIHPIDTHAHAFKLDPEFYSMLKRLHMHLLDICVATRDDPNFADLQSKIQAAKAFVRASGGHAALCTTFDPFASSSRKFADHAIHGLNQDFTDGAVAVKIWKNIGMELKDANGRFVLPDDPMFQPIYRDIAAHGRTLVAHLAEPDSCWLPPNKNSPDYNYYREHPEWYMYGKPDHPSKQAILAARDHLLEKNPDLRVVGAHLGSMETNLEEIGHHFDRYPNFAVDTAARVVYFTLQPREKARDFLIKYQDRVLYGTDLGFYSKQNTGAAVAEWEKMYAADWRYFATDDVMTYRGRKVRGLQLPGLVLRKLYHDNAARWIPGVLGEGKMADSK